MVSGANAVCGDRRAATPTTKARRSVATLPSSRTRHSMIRRAVDATPSRAERLPTDRILTVAVSFRAVIVLGTVRDVRRTGERTRLQRGSSTSHTPRAIAKRARVMGVKMMQVADSRK